jgi:HTH-type transcriptional regulator / antitoxin HigA
MMDLRPIRNDEDLRSALAEVERLWGAPEGSPEGDKLDILATLIDAYERDHFPVSPSTPLEMLRYAVGDMGHTQSELAEIVGSRSLASQILSGTRRISLDAAQKISASWQIPIQLLVTPYDIKAA